MERCTLCGGRLVNGRCTSCGLDNTKNDRKYHLNTHNEKSAALFHRGDCEDHLNRDNGYGDNWPWKKKQPATAGLESYQRNRTAAGTTTAATSSAEASAGADAASVRTSTTVRTSTASQVPQGTAQSLSESTAAGSASAKSSAAPCKELKKRSQTGTVRKRRGAGRAIKFLFLFFILLFVVFPIVAQKVIEYRRSNGGGIFGGNSTSDNGPEEISWDEEDEQYYGIRLEPGVYEVGYEIPAGKYQLHCAQESAFVYWREADAKAYDTTELTLYSPERQASYRDFWDEDCPYYQYSDIVALEEGTEVVVETGLDIGGVELEGLTDPGAVCKEREPQQGLEEVQLEDNMVAGRDFPAGTYNLILDDADDEYTYSAVSLSVHAEDRNYTAEVSSEQPVYWRIPLKGGDELKILYKSDEATAHLIPSF